MNETEATSQHPKCVTTESRRCVCEGRFELDATPEQVFPLFTPRGEIDWVPGWQPEFVHPTDGELVEDQVFVTEHGDETTLWSVLHADIDGRRAEYLRVTPGSRLGRVAVAVDPTAGGSTITVRYVLTALTAEAVSVLRGFADGYDAMLVEWRDRTADALRRAEASRAGALRPPTGSVADS
ncbi:MAG: SRPBCC family protein [Acidobacteriota bacterium]